MSRFRLILAYDGRPFSGWQSQPDGNAVQDHLEKALAAIAGSPVRAHGSGRTDAGVHALGQVAHIDAPPSSRMDAGAWQRALNAHLPPTIRVLEAEAVAGNFHARFDATGKTYRYRLWHGDVLPPLEHGLAWHVRGPLDLGRLREAAAVFEGEHDFRAFAASRGDGAESRPGFAVRTIRVVAVEAAGPAVTLTFSGTGFLYRMVRLMTGSAVRVAQGRAELAWLRELVDSPGTAGKSAFCAPPDGLTLVAVDYGGGSPG